MTRAHERIETARLILRKPAYSDAEAIFENYASHPDVTRFLAFPTHRSIEDTHYFLQCSETEWQQWPAGPFLIELREQTGVIGSTGLAFPSDDVAQTGYVLARNAWGYGYATEALHAIVNLAGDLDILRLTALCHPDNIASQRVLEKCGFVREPRMQLEVFPNLDGSAVLTLVFANQIRMRA